MAIVIKPRRYLDDREFREYLGLVRKIAKFVPEEKHWVFSPQVMERRGVGKSELKRIVARLVELGALDEENAARILASVSKGRITVDFTRLILKASDDNIVPPTTGLEKVGAGLYIVLNPGTVDRIVSFLRERGVEIEVIGRLEPVLVKREEGRIVIRHSALNVVEKVLRPVCTVTYRIEKPVFNEDGSFKEVRIIEKPLRLLRRRNGFLEAPVGILHRIVSRLRENKFPVVEDLDPRKELRLDFSPRYRLLPHQEDAYKHWHRHMRGVIAIFTRGGKSYIALKAIEELRLPTLILVTTRELMETWKKYLVDELGVPPSELGFLGGGLREVRGITIATYASAIRYAELLKQRFELVVFDESHHVPARVFKNVAIQVDALYRMGLSATPRRRDGNEELLYALCGPLVFKLDYKELLDLKMVAPVEVFETIYVNGPDEKIEKLLSILEKHREEKTFIFTQRLETAENIYKTLLGKGFKARLLTGQTPAGERRWAFKDFLEGRVNIVVTTTVLDEGITVPDAEVAVIYEGTGEPRQMIQRIGRVLGYYPGKTAKIYEIVDFTNPREKAAHFRRRWVKELYVFPGIEEYVRREREGRVGKRFYQYRL